MSEPNVKTAHPGTDRWFAMGDEQQIAERPVSPTREQATVVARSEQRAKRGGVIAALAAALLISTVALVAHFGGAKKPLPPLAIAPAPSPVAPAPAVAAPAPAVAAPAPVVTAPAPAAAAPAIATAPAHAHVAKQKRHKPAKAKAVTRRR